MRRVSTPTHDHQVKLGLTSLGATAERAGPRSLPQTGDSETDGMGQGGRQAGDQRPITPLWKGSLASSADRPGVAWNWQGASARGGLRLRKGHPQPQPFFPGSPAETSRAPRENAGRGRVCGRSQDSSLRPRRHGAPKPRPTTEEGGASSLAIPRNSGRQRQARPRIRGHPAQDPSREGSLAR